MKWCCLTFKVWYDAAGKRGLAVLVGRNSSGQAEFLMQQRAIDRTVQSLPVTEYPISLVSDICIVYCPWCGRNLKKWYGKYIDELDRPNFRTFNPSQADTP